MGSLRDIQGESLAEQSRIRALMKEGITLSGMSEENYSEFIEQLLRQPPVKFHDHDGGRSRREFALLWARSAWEDHRRAEGDLKLLLGLPEDWYSKAPFLYPRRTLELVWRHGCAACEWQEEGLCIRSEEEEAIPETCPGFERWTPRGA
jgi:hypothetical protein